MRIELPSYFELSRLEDEPLLESGDMFALLGAGVSACLAAHVAVIDDRQLPLERGFASTSEYCQLKWGLSKYQAGRLLTVARTGQRYPFVFELLKTARINQTNVLLVRRYLTSENHRDLLTMACGMSKAALRYELASRYPNVADEPTLRGIDLPPRPTPPPPADPDDVIGQARQATAESEYEKWDMDADVRPVSADVYMLKTPLMKEAVDDFLEARDLNGRCGPEESWPELLAAAARALVTARRKQKWGETDQPRKGKSPEDCVLDKLPAKIRREVWLRDEGRCAYVSEDGRRCTCKSGLQFDHINPKSIHGAPTSADEVRLLCWRHNQFMADKELGRAFMNAKRAKPASFRTSANVKGAQT